ncbi:MAG: hypothetical protein LBI87_10990 [Candidatus Accumulibacter sp.]|jgi:hypothetical protein|nr:hypothetical protein [Accumulibacter sp.]
MNKDYDPEALRRGIEVLNEMLREEPQERQGVIKTRRRNVDRLKSASRWIVKSVMWLISRLWSLFGPLITILALFIIAPLLIFAWSFIAYQIAWFVLDDTAGRVCLLVFLVFAPIFAVAGPAAWLTGSEAAQAEYTADRLAEKLRKKESNGE